MHQQGIQIIDPEAFIRPWQQGILFIVSGIEGSYSNVVGLPVEELLEALKKLEIV